MLGLTPKTEKIFNKISLLPSVKDYTLIGGTALSLQINKRLSDDLDFCVWSTNLKNDKPEVNWPLVKHELETIGKIEKQDILGFNHVNFIVDSVKISFFTKQQNLSPVTNPVHILNNIKVADIDSIGVMKIEVILRRSVFRDYYDIYSILKEGRSINKLLLLASNYSNHTLKTKNALSFLLNGNNFRQDNEFKATKPFYNVNSEEIQNYIKELLLKENPMYLKIMRGKIV